jgi:hypothetical protein
MSWLEVRPEYILRPLSIVSVLEKLGLRMGSANRGFARVGILSGRFEKDRVGIPAQLRLGVLLIGQGLRLCRLCSGA